MGEGFVRFLITKNSLEILKRPKAFSLLAQIALKAKRNTLLSVLGLKYGEALITDPQLCGLTQQEYRTAKKQLAEFNLVSFRATNRGTVAKLMNSSIFELVPDWANKQATNRQQAANKRKPAKGKRFKFRRTPKKQTGLAG